ncbi:MAG: MBOAT family O-acyltransferase [Acidimicrobiales bacterium]
MLFPTATFAAFFVAVYGLHVVFETQPRAWKWAMLGASYVFYGWWDWRFSGLLALSTTVNWALGRAVGRTVGDRRHQRLLVASAVVINLAGLGVFKYFGFFVEAMSAGLGSANPLPVVDVALPIGISFFTFQALSYVIDIHRGALRPRSLLDVAVYLSFFPQLVAGPIVRGSEFCPQLDRPAGRVDVGEAFWLIGRGLVKKMVIATYLAETVVDPTFAAPTVASKAELLLALYGYAIQIYADFSGYTDIAIGIALLLGFRFPVNFDRPYAATSIQDFWRRWHMTLSRWLRDYLYVPLGGNRGSSAATYRNLMITMILGGLWHGAAWTFVVWGALHGVALSVERARTVRVGLSHAAGTGGDRPGRVVVRWLVTFHLVCLAWLPFRAPDFAVAGDVVRGLLFAPTWGPVTAGPVLVIAGALAAQLAPPDLGHRVRGFLVSLDPAAQAALAGVWVALVATLGPEGVAPFIYFQF